MTLKTTKRLFSRIAEGTLVGVTVVVMEMALGLPQPTITGGQTVYKGGIGNIVDWQQTGPVPCLVMMLSNPKALHVLPTIAREVLARWLELSVTRFGLWMTKGLQLQSELVSSCHNSWESTQLAHRMLWTTF
jgi:hypothetical protein